MAILKVVIGFKDLRDDDLDTKAASIIKSITGNTNYTTPVPTLAVVQTALTAYETALTAAKNGSPEKTAIKDQKRKDLEALLKQLGTYVQRNCKMIWPSCSVRALKLLSQKHPLVCWPSPKILKWRTAPTQAR